MSTSDPAAASPLATFLVAYAQARAGLTAPGAPFELTQEAGADGQPLRLFRHAFPDLAARLSGVGTALASGAATGPEMLRPARAR